MDFTLPKYKELCEALLDFGYRVTTVRDFISSHSSEQEGRSAILRHDVDRRPQNALRMAELEHNMRARSTYYFRATRSSFVPEIMKAIEAYGHEVGYHYETVVQSRGDMQKAVHLFGDTLQGFRKVCRIETVSFHGSPLSQWDNRKLWENYSFRDFDVLGDPYFSVDYSKVVYLSDTGRTWNSERHKVRDKTDAAGLSLDSTDQLVEFLKHCGKNVLINIHPERWTNSTVGYVASLFTDFSVNMAKSIISFFR